MIHRMNYTRNQVALAVIVILALIIGIIWKVQQADDSLSVVYLSTGEVYIGKLTTFPMLTLAADGYQFQTVPGQRGAAPGTQLVPLADAQWAPKKLYLNRDQVVLYGPLSEESVIFQTLQKRNATTTSQ